MDRLQALGVTPTSTDPVCVCRISPRPAAHASKVKYMLQRKDWAKLGRLRIEMQQQSSSFQRTLAAQTSKAMQSTTSHNSAVQGPAQGELAFFRVAVSVMRCLSAVRRTGEFEACSTRAVLLSHRLLCIIGRLAGPVRVSALASVCRPLGAPPWTCRCR